MRIAKPGEWFSRRRLAPELDMFTEPHVHSFVRANVFHLRGRDRDLVVDTGMGLARLSAALDLTPGKPVLAIATHIHLDHVGSLHEFAERAGPRMTAEAFGIMPDELTYAGMFRELAEPVTLLPSGGWRAEAYAIPPRRSLLRSARGTASISATDASPSFTCPAIRRIRSACWTSATECSSAATLSTTRC